MIRNCIKPIMASVCMAIVIFILKQPIEVLGSFIGNGRIIVFIYTLIYTIILVGIGGFVYFYVMIVLGGIRKLDIEAVSPRIYRILPRFIRKKIR